MSARPASDRLENRLNVTSACAPSSGGSLQQYVHHLNSIGTRAEMLQDERSAWRWLGAGVVQRFPVECTAQPGAESIDQLLGGKGVRILDYLLEPSEALPANCFDYVCSNTVYSIDRLSGNTRSKVRRGLRRFDIRLCTAGEIRECGYRAAAETAERHGLPPPPMASFQGAERGDVPLDFYEYWGAWQDSNLLAWVKILKIDDWASVGTARSCTEALKNFPNNALVFSLTRRLLREGRRLVSYGLNPMEASDAAAGLHKFKRSMNFEAIPLHRVFLVSGLLAVLIKSHTFSWALEALSRCHRTSERLRKAVGLSRWTSGREKNPLAWAQDE